MINEVPTSGEAGTAGTGGGSSASVSAGTGGGAGGGTGAGHVQFRMTVKLDIEGHVPSTSSSTSSSCATATVDATSAAAQTTQDLLLKLQPLLPHLCISKESTTMLRRTVSATNAEQHLRQVQELVQAPASATCDESELELSLGLSMFKKSGTVNTTETATPTDTSNIINTASCQPENCWSSRGGRGRELFQEGEGKQQPPQVSLQRQSSNAGGMVRSESLALDWRAMEEHRLKREAQYQRRQEARKKRRILIDEQKQQRKAAAAARGASSTSGTTLIKQPSRSVTLGSDVNVTGGAADEQKQVQQQHEHEAFKDEKVTTDDSPSVRKSACRSRSYTKTRRRTKLQQPNSSTVTSASKVKTEVEEAPVTPTAGVIRPSPVHEPNQEWVQKFLEMQSMVAKTLKPEEREQHEQHEQHEQQQQQQQQQQQRKLRQAQGDREEQADFESTSPTKRLKRMSSLPGMTRQGSFNLKRISSPPPVPPYRDTAMDSQCSSVCSSRPLTTGLFTVPATYSTLIVPNKGPQVAQVVKSPRSAEPVGAPSSALLRSASLGTFQMSNEQQQQHSIQMPSPVRSSNNNAHLLRTLSEGAALRALARAVEQEKAGSLVNRNSKSSAFKSPKKEPTVPEQQQQQQQQPSSMTSGGTSGETMVRPGEGALAELPLVSTRGPGPNGKLVNGVLLAYRKGEVKIVCSCHGQHMTAKEFVEHAGGVDVSNPEKCIVVSPSKRSRLDS